MSNESQTTANTPNEPRLCKMGCGFFGNGATDGCCSKCWRDLQKKSDHGVTPVQPTFCTPISEGAQLMDVEPEAPVTATTLQPPAPSADAKKNKKKTSYKNLMAGMMSGTERDLEKEKESLRKVTGGGAFSKIDKI